MAIGRWVGVFWSAVIGQALARTPWTSLRSSPVATRDTPRIALAAVVSIEVIFAWA